MKRLPLHQYLTFFAFLCVSATGFADARQSESAAIEVSGPAKVIDGDTLVIGSQVIRIDGIDAPEDAQTCKRSGGAQWSCGAEATAALARLSTSGVRCAGHEFDAYKRLIARCSASGNDIGEALVLDGLALAYRQYSTHYVPYEDTARNARRGIWQGSFIEPWQWRKTQWKLSGNAAPSPECPIKGNISRNGTRIYHAPWSRSYSRTRIDVSEGERWFCNEAEALAAGWRAPFR